MAEKIMIWAQTNNGTIGNELKIPWREKADMQFFKAQTLDQVILMGRNTMDSFNGRPLPKRVNLVLTSQADLVVPEGFQAVNTLAEADQIADELGKDLLIIGGSAVYTSLLTEADILYVTYLDTDFSGDTIMPQVDKTVWQGVEIQAGLADPDNEFDYVIVKYSRR
ncbi:MAG: dihydrofolate reductase [Lactobacillaceae bacterium]|jgi:dihydrofolate reductase|nr:dihydrofolate reductase [Lactobacillaceae bacterium]